MTLMQVAAPIKDNDGDVVGALALIVNPDEEFTKILSVARTGKTGETYAFDQTGLLISESRFDVETQRKGTAGSDQQIGVKPAVARSGRGGGGGKQAVDEDGRGGGGRGRRN